MKTCEPSGRMKSGLLMSTPSAKNATLTPAPVARFAACGIDGSLNATCMVCSASGSSSGFDGSDGQMPLCGVVGLPGSNDDGAATLGPEAVGDGALLIAASGITAATRGSASSRCCAPAETIAAKPLST